MKDKYGMVIYVGKVKVLKNWVCFYFIGFYDGKMFWFVNDIVDFEYIVIFFNLEVFILEMNLIKKYDLKYNIMFKDDKGYFFIKIIVEK